jgi:hypothetical protein
MDCDKEAFAALWQSSSRNRLDMTCDSTPPPRHLYSPDSLLAEVLCDIVLVPVEREALPALLPPMLCDKEGRQWRNAGSYCDISQQQGDKKGDTKIRFALNVADHRRFAPLKRGPSGNLLYLVGSIPRAAP